MIAQVIQRRGLNDDHQRRINFTKDWSEYKDGFGDLRGEFWMGNEMLSELTVEQMILRIDLKAHDGRSAFAEYSTFR